MIRMFPSEKRLSRKSPMPETWISSFCNRTNFVLRNSPDRNERKSRRHAHHLWMECLGESEIQSSKMLCRCRPYFYSGAAYTDCTSFQAAPATAQAALKKDEPPEEFVDTLFAVLKDQLPLQCPSHISAHVGRNNECRLSVMLYFKLYQRPSIQEKNWKKLIRGGSLCL